MASVGLPTSCCPSSSIEPPKMVLMPMMAFIKVLLPEPLGPSTALKCWAAKLRLRSCRISSCRNRRLMRLQ